MVSESRKRKFENYDKNLYIDPYILVNNVVLAFDEVETDNYKKMPEKVLKVLLIKRDGEDVWELPGGFIYKEDDIYTSAKRKLQEKTGIEDIYMEQLYTFGEKDRDPSFRSISVCYMSLINQVKLSANLNYGVEQAKWFELQSTLHNEKKVLKDGVLTYLKDFKLSLKNKNIILNATVRYSKNIKNNIVEREFKLLDKRGISYDHAKIIIYAFSTLRNKLESTDIAFGLVKDKFTLMELQQVFETILQKKYTKSNFQRKIKPFLLATDEYKTGVGFRPAKLYRFNPEWDEV